MRCGGLPTLVLDVIEGAFFASKLVGIRTSCLIPHVGVLYKIKEIKSDGSIKN